MVDSDGGKKEVYKKLIASYFDEIRPADYSFSATLRHAIQSIISRLFEIVVMYFGKYDEAEFHRRMRMAYTLIDRKTGARYDCDGFDFIGDWKKYHRTKFIFFVKTINLNKLWFRFREEKIYEVITELLREKGWTLDEREVSCIRQCVRRLHNILYHNRDTLEQL